MVKLLKQAKIVQRAASKNVLKSGRAATKTGVQKKQQSVMRQPFLRGATMPPNYNKLKTDYNKLKKGNWSNELTFYSQGGGQKYGYEPWNTPGNPAYGKVPGYRNPTSDKIVPHYTSDVYGTYPMKRKLT